MRSRYSAYVMGYLDYLFATTHPTSRKAGLMLALRSTYESTQWIGLKVIETFQGGERDVNGKVEFEAVYIQSGRKSIHREKSRFKRYAGKWYYLDGKLDERGLG